MHIQQLLNQIRESEHFAGRVERRIATLNEGRGMENIPTCPTCNRATVLLEHEYQPQLTLIRSDMEQPVREETYFTCEWCGSEIRDVSPKAARKPAGRAMESDVEWARRIA
jgi:hypothetical protein